MKNFKMRAWDQVNKSWYPYPFLVDNNGIAFIFDEEREGDEYYQIRGASMVMGLKKCLFADIQDKNGKDCFTDDIIKTDYGTGKIIFHHGCFMIEWIDDPEANMELLAFEPNGYKYGRPRQFEIIGNIYENPKLLKKAQ